MLAGSLDVHLPEPGSTLAGKYQIVQAIGRGGMGVVLEARHLRLGRSVALKLLLPELRAAPDVTSRFEREARAVARLTNTHVAKILDVDSLPDGSPFIVMELLRGHDLADELARCVTLPIRQAIGYVLQACEAMADAHAHGIVHRDLKPSNLFLAEQSGGPATIKVLDFGISKLAGDVGANVTQTQSAFGTPLYMSPEQVRSAKNVDGRADIWSLGVILYELLAGQPPFYGESATGILAAIVADAPTPISELRPDLPPGLAASIMRSLEKQPQARFADVAAFAAAIAPYGPGSDLVPSPGEPSAVSIRTGPIGLELGVLSRSERAEAATSLAPTAPKLPTLNPLNSSAHPRVRALALAAAVFGVCATVAAAVLFGMDEPAPPSTQADVANEGQALPQVDPTSGGASSPIPSAPSLAPAPEVTPAPGASAQRPAASSAPSPPLRRPQGPIPTARPSTAPAPPSQKPTPADDPKYL
ncbi:MAG: protein kinase [Polyangiaceae bacterium]